MAAGTPCEGPLPSRFRAPEAKTVKIPLCRSWGFFSAPVQKSGRMEIFMRKLTGFWDKFVKVFIDDCYTVVLLLFRFHHLHERIKYCWLITL